MRTIAITLLLAAAGAAFADTTAKKPAPMKTAERLALMDLQAKRVEIDKQINQIITEACTDRGIALARCRIQPNGEFQEVAEPVKETKE